MSCTVAPTSAADPLLLTPRKRTMSFSTPTPCKVARTPLRRTGSYLSLADMQAAEHQDLYGRSGPTKSLSLGNSIVIGQCDSRTRKRRAAPSRPSASNISSAHTSPAPSSPHAYLCTSRRTTPCPRRSSLLAPVQRPISERPSLPCTKKREPNLYRIAIETRMRMSPVGCNILNLGPRAAISVFKATEALESLIAAHSDWDMQEVALDASWVDVSQDDWEMVERDE